MRRGLSRAALLLAVGLGGSRAWAETPHEIWEAGFVAAVAEVWPAQVQGDRIHELPDDVRARLGQVKQVLREAKERQLTDLKVRFFEACTADLEGLQSALAEVLPAVVEAHKATESLLGLERDAVGRLTDLVEKTAGQKEDRVLDAFDALKRDVESTQARYEKSLAQVTAALGKGTAWRARLPLFGDVDQALDRRVQQITHALEDTFDRVFEASKAVRAAKAGEAGVLCELCLAGDKEEALAYLRSWQPPKVLHAHGIANVFAYPAEAGWLDVVAHGDPKSVDIEIRDVGKIDADAETLFKSLKRHLTAEDLPRWQRLNDDLNVGLRLISCKTGASWTGIAQQLANLTGFPVKAPSDTLWIVAKGGEVHGVIHSCPDCAGARPGLWLYDHVLASTKRGVWRTFQPQGDEAARKRRDLLLDLAEKEPWWQVTVTDVTPAKDKAEADKRIETLRRLGARASKDELTKLLASGKEFVVIERLTRKEARAKAVEVGRLGLKCKGGVMAVHAAKFKDIKLD